ncbi:DNA primase [Lacibacterium aquatile]|uniref:DNA primase n=1 Tax=Lacibacterium aquatile TaxID=1168082 RepID=A0ABW5DNI4_9PROT
MAFPPEFLEELRGRITLSSVVGRRVKLAKKGREFSGLCPFHNEKSPSFFVNDDKAFYHCFGCGKHGDAVSFVIDTEGLGFREAVERLAGEAGMEVPTDTPVDREVVVRRQGAEAACEAAAAYFQEQLRTNDGKDALAYLLGRGVTQQDISHHRLGWAPDRREGLKQSLIAKGFTEDVLIEAGLIILPEDRPGTYDRFRGRVMFPIADRRGKVIAFGGRAMGDAKPKYLNSPETSLFHKGRTLYALNHARIAAAREGRVIVVEGYMDVVAMHRKGFATAVAPLGTALTEEQMGELWKLAPEPILCLDGDSAGQRAMARAAERALPLLKPGKSLRFATLPEGQDPDDLLAQPGGAEKLRRALADAIPLIEALWRIETGVHSLDTPEKKAEFKVRLRDRVSSIKNDDVRALYGQDIQARLEEKFGRLERFAPGAVPPRHIDREAEVFFNGRLFQAGKSFRAGERNERNKKNNNKKNHSAGLRMHLASLEYQGASTPIGPNEDFIKVLPANADRVTSAIGAEQALELLTLMIFNPVLAEEALESLADITLADAALDSLCREIVSVTAAHPGLDVGTLQSHLTENGHALTLQQVTTPDVLNRYPLARPDAYLPDARTRARVLLADLKRSRLKADMEEASAVLAAEASPEAWERVKRLREQIATMAAEQE